MQQAPGSAFVSHVAIETSYIHGRKRRSIAQENALVFPRHFYNNFYELTKAMASIETDRYLIDEGLRVAQLLPSIVIGDSRTGNNRGDTKVVNAPINAFGRAKEAIDQRGRRPRRAARRARLVAAAGHRLPGRPLRGAEPGARGPRGGGHPGRAHRARRPSATASTSPPTTASAPRTWSASPARSWACNVRLADPTLYRNVTLPMVKAVLERARASRKLASALEKLGTIFGGYGEWGQPVHDVGNDVRILGPAHPPARTPSTPSACCAGTTGTCRSSAACATRTRWRGGSGLGETRSTRSSCRPATRRAPSRRGEFRRLLGDEIDLRTFQAASRLDAAGSGR